MELFLGSRSAIFLVQVQWGHANTPEHAMSYAQELVENLGCEVDTEACMQNATVEAIVQNTYLHGTHVDGLWQVGFDFQWTLSDPQAVDDSSFTSNPFLPGTPKDLLESGQFNTEVKILFWPSQSQVIIITHVSRWR